MAARSIARSESRRVKRNRDRDGDLNITVDTLIVTGKKDEQDDLESEKTLFNKLTRVNDRVMKQLEEVAIKSAALEAQFRVRESNWAEKISLLETKLEQMRTEEERNRKSLRGEIEKGQEKLAAREKEFEKRMKAKEQDHADAKERVAKAIAQSAKRATDADEIADLEARIRNETSLMEEAEDDNEKFLQQCQTLDSNLERSAAKNENLKEKFDELEATNLDMRLGEKKKEAVEKELKELEKEIYELEEVEENNKDNQDVLSELKQKIRSAKLEFDEKKREKDQYEKKVSRARSGVDATSTDRTTNTSRLNAIRKTDNSVVDRVRQNRQRVAKQQGTALDRIRARQANRKESSGLDRQEERKLKNAKDAIKTLQRDGKRELDALDKTVAKSESTLAKTMAEYEKMEANEKSLSKLIEQEKETLAAEIAVMKAHQEQSENNVQAATFALKKMKKALSDAKFNHEERKTELEKLTTDHNTRKKQLGQVEIDVKQRERAVERADRELKGATKTYQDTLLKQKETEGQRADTQLAQQTTHIELAVLTKDKLLEIHTLEAEIYDQTEQREALVKLNAEQLKELQDLRFYFKPQREKGSVEARVLGTREHDEISRQSDTRNSELETIKKAVGALNIEHQWKQKSMQELKKGLDRILQEMDDETRGDILFELKDLTEAMKMQMFSQRRILAIVSLLAKHEVYPGAIRELAVLTNMNDELHVMERPEMLLKIIHKEYTRDGGDDAEYNTSFRRRLLEKLVSMRMKRTNRTAEQAEDYIFYGEERDYDDIYEEYDELAQMEGELEALEAESDAFDAESSV